MPNRIPGDRNGKINALKPEKLLIIVRKHSSHNSRGFLAQMFTDKNGTKLKLPIKDFFSKCDQIHRNPRIWLHLLKKSLIENFLFSEIIHDN